MIGDRRKVKSGKKLRQDWAGALQDFRDQCEKDPVQDMDGLIIINEKDAEELIETDLEDLE